MNPLKPAILAGLIGAGLQASRTPAMHEREGAMQGLRYQYRLIDLDVLGLGANALPELLVAAERMGFSGLNITHPCKQSVIPYISELSVDALAIGAVNTVQLRAGKRIGHNTDWWAFAESFRRGLPDVARQRVVQLGAGGAGAAVAHAALTLGTQHLALFDTNRPRAEKLAAQLGVRFGAGRVTPSSDVSLAMARADGLIHATPTGMHAYPGLPLPAALLHRDLCVADIVYFPLETELLKSAAERGCRTLNGGGMAVFQAVEAFRLFTNVAPDINRMLGHFDSMASN